MRYLRKRPSASDLSLLPPHGQVAFAARCARRAAPALREWPSLPIVYTETFERAVGLAEDCAAGRAYDLGQLSVVVGAAEALSELALQERRNGTRFAAAAAAQAIRTALAAGDTSSDPAQEAFRTANCVVYAGVDRGVVWADYEVLIEGAQGEAWSAATHVPAQFFSLRSSFESDELLIQCASAIDAKLLEYFHKNPAHLYSLTPRQFEELIAQLFDGFGYTVELTQRTRDGGRDIIAISNTPTRIRHLIECKRFSPSRKVGLAIVQRLHGVVQGEYGTTGILATTAPLFTKPASEFLERHRWVLEGRAFDGVVQWLDRYQRCIMDAQFKGS